MRAPDNLFQHKEVFPSKYQSDYKKDNYLEYYYNLKIKQLITLAFQLSRIIIIDQTQIQEQIIQYSVDFSITSQALIRQ
ncbi:unnamed protein product [Paramecium sonneborni]|uniref:Uncharacterized protein n=1 Tax=Paramecium sonneborni TaxID=65129 RepID=A0A8S1RJ66_9CILI|nr:unnamed protein product [Paramecium sonneborni]